MSQRGLRPLSIIPYLRTREGRLAYGHALKRGWSGILDQFLRKKVYVVDDDDAVRDSMCIFLEACGLDVHEFRSAREFLATMCARPSGCLLLDLHMPEMNGLELLELLRERGSQLPVVMFTGRSASVLKERAQRSGAVMLDKPVRDDVLLKALDNAFDARAQVN